MTVDTDLEVRLRDAFARSAADAPVHPPAAGETPLLSTRPLVLAAPWRAPRRAVAAVVIGAAAAAALLVALRDTRQDSVPAFRPPGTEVPLHQVAPPDPGVPVAPGSLVGLEVPGHPVIARFDTLMWQDGRVGEHSCTWSNGGSGCMPTWNLGPDLSRTSTVDNRDGTFDLYTWADVPPGTAFVGWESPAGPLWQRPVAGFVGFPVTTEFGGDSRSDRLVAYDVDGNVVDEVDYDVYIARLRASTPPGGWQTDPDNPQFLAYATTDNLGSAQHTELADLTTATVSDCIAEPGATWEACIAETEAVVDARFAELGGEIIPYEPPADSGAAELPVSITMAPPS